MTLDPQYILDIINNRPNYDRIKSAQDQYAKLYSHYTGDNVEEYIDDLPEFMREGTKDTLIKLMRGNADVIHRVMNPRDKIYYAKGGMMQINIPVDEQTAFYSFLSKITEGMSMDEFIRNKVQPHYDYDPNGLIQIEINSNNMPYPKVRCINEVYDYMNNGRALEYVVFEVSKEDRTAYIAAGLLPNNTALRDKVYRVIDDVADRIIILKSGSITRKATLDGLVIASEIPNEFGYVPCMIISDIWGNKEIMDSPLSVCIELLDDILTDNALYSWAYWRNAFPKEWMQLMKCPTCGGHKEVNGSDCPECHGNGYAPFMRTSDVARIDYKADENKSIPNPPIGVVQPPIEALQFMVDNNVSLEDYFSYTMWGVQKVISRGTQGKPAGKGGNVSNTAYEAQLNEQPQHDRLRIFGSWKVSVQRFIIDCCAWYIYRDNFEGSAIICGDRFMIESPDATWDRYLKAVQGKAPMFALDTLLTEYNENKFAGNPEMFRQAELMRQVEPFVHEDVSAIWTDGTLPLTTRLMKKYFDEWTSTLTSYDIASVPDEGGADILRQMLFNYVTGKYVAERKMDAILLTSMGQVLEVGDQVQVIHGLQKKANHLGEIFTVSDIDENQNITIKGGGMDGVFGYKTTDVFKAYAKTIA